MLLPMRWSHAMFRMKKKLSYLQNLRLFAVLRLIKSLKVSFRVLRAKRNMRCNKVDSTMVQNHCVKHR